MSPERRSDLRQNRKWTVLLQRPKLRSVAQTRWSGWARSFATRHLRSAPRRDLLDLVVAHPRALVHLLRERWLITSRRVQPKIDLAIHAILKLTVNQQQRSSVTHTGAQSPSVGMQTATFLNATRSMSTARQTLSKAHVPVKAFEKPSSPNPEDVVFNDAAPLTMVFRRVEETQKLTRSRVLEALMDQREHSIARRVTRRSRRSETMVINGSTLTRRQILSAGTEAIPSHSMKLAPLTKLTPAAVKVVESSTIKVPTTTTVESTSSQKESTALRDLNLDQITDQVVRRLDHRVIALRERLGRI